MSYMHTNSYTLRGFEKLGEDNITGWGEEFSNNTSHADLRSGSRSGGNTRKHLPCTAWQSEKSRWRWHGRCLAPPQCPECQNRTEIDLKHVHTTCSLHTARPCWMRRECAPPEYRETTRERTPAKGKVCACAFQQRCIRLFFFLSSNPNTFPPSPHFYPVNIK